MLKSNNYLVFLPFFQQSGGSADPSHTQRWKTLAIVRGTFGPEDCYGDVAEIKFERPVPIKVLIAIQFKIKYVI